MEGRVRRVVTGHDENGKAIVTSDGYAPAVRTNPLRPGHISTDIWKTDGTPVHIGNETDPTLGPRQIHPPKQGTVVRIADIPPESDAIRNLDPAKSRELYLIRSSQRSSRATEIPVW